MFYRFVLPALFLIIGFIIAFIVIFSHQKTSEEHIEHLIKVNQLHLFDNINDRVLAQIETFEEVESGFDRGDVLIDEFCRELSFLLVEIRELKPAEDVFEIEQYSSSVEDQLNSLCSSSQNQ